MLNRKEFIRYSRQIMLDTHGESGQEALKQARVLVIGMGGLGCPAAQYLAGAGVGQLVLADHDYVDASNLHRQILYSSEQVGELKVEAARQRLQQINPLVTVIPVAEKLDEQSIGEQVQQADVVLDCTDNIHSRYLINRACRAQRKALIIGAGIRYDAQVISFDHAQSLPGCYQCLVPDAQDEAFNCATAGAMGPVLGIAGSMQALSAIKYLTNAGFVHNLWQCFDGRTQRWISIQHKGDKSCEVCGEDCLD